MVTNPSGIEPIGGHLVVEVEKSETEKRLAALGMEMPKDSKERDRLANMAGRIVAAADDARYGLPGFIGRKAMFGRYAGTTIKGADGEDYRILYDEDVKGVYHA